MIPIVPADSQRQAEELLELELYPLEHIRPDSDRPVLDVGAHVGLFGFYLHSIGIENRVHSIEPIAENYEILLRNQGPDDSAANVAVANRNGALLLRRHLADASTRWRSDPDLDAFGTEERFVPCVRFRELLGSSWSIVKLDIEGHEAEVILDTPPELLGRLEVLVLETHGHRVQEILEAVAAAGLRQVFSRLDRHRVFRRA